MKRRRLPFPCIFLATLLMAGCAVNERVGPRDGGAASDVRDFKHDAPDVRGFKHDAPDVRGFKRDAPGDFSASGCGTHAVFGSTCPTACAAPCICHQVVSDPSPMQFPFVCAAPCKDPWDCPSAERCGFIPTYKAPDAGLPTVCLPEKIIIPPSASYGGGSIDCVFHPFMGRLYCRGTSLFQIQFAWLSGVFTGCVEVDVARQHCPAGCKSFDGGAACLPTDAGPAKPDGLPQTCCPVAQSPYWCFFVGGPKTAAGCPLACCTGTCQGWTASVNSGCKIWNPPASDAAHAQ